MTRDTAFSERTRQQMEELYAVLLEDIVRRLKKPDPPAELLSVARTLFLAAGPVVGDISGKHQATLSRLRRLHLVRLLEAVQDTEKRPTAAIFGEVRQLLASAPFQDLVVDMKARAEASKLALASLPFPAIQ